MTKDELANWQILTNLYKRLAANDDINGSEARALQSVITKLWHDGTAEPPIIEWHQRGGDTASVPTTHICPVCGGTLESRGGYIRVIIGKRDMTSEVQGASWYCAKCDRAWDYGDLPPGRKEKEKKMLLSEMFGVERDVEFEVIGYIGRFILRERSDGTERLW